jgi:hypothetical protein
MVCWAAISLMTGPWAACAARAAVAWAAGTETALAPVATTSPATAIAAVITFLCFNARHFLYSGHGHIRHAYVAPVADGRELRFRAGTPRVALINTTLTENGTI